MNLNKMNLNKKNLIIELLITVSILLPNIITGEESSDKFYWQKPNCTITETGDIQWAPKPFKFTAGPSIRYIDFKNGTDSNDGTSKDTPWKHHPWDTNAKGNAKACKGIHTYVFKRGVIYRGLLSGTESGTAEEPIRLTSDPSWGKGEASLYGSNRVTGTWKAGGATSLMPDKGKIWSINFPHNDFLTTLWEVKKDGEPTRLSLAREPNWTIEDEDNPMDKWNRWTGTHYIGKQKKRAKLGRGASKKVARDEKNIPPQSQDYYKDIIIWSSYDGNMSAPYRIMSGKDKRSKIKYFPEYNGFTQISNPQGKFCVATGKGKKRTTHYHAGAPYFLENCDPFLDEGGEFLAKGKTIYLRLPNDKNPNNAIIEVGTNLHIINLFNTKNVEISGLKFSFNRPGRAGYPQMSAEYPAIRIVGDCSEVKIRNNVFSNLMTAIVGYPRMRPKTKRTYCKKDVMPASGAKEDILRNITLSDNDSKNLDSMGFFFLRGMHGNPNPRESKPQTFHNVRILRNRFYNVGFRQYNSMYSSIPAIGVKGSTLLEVSGNVIDRAYGAGIWVYGGPKGASHGRPMIRNFIHHNKVTNSLLTSNDWGGIESWIGGPTYIYNNISYNAIGPRHAGDMFRKSYVWREYSSNAFSFYLDHGFKHYLFNNLARGKYSDKSKLIMNRCGGMMVAGFLNTWSNNTFHNFVYGLGGTAGTRNAFMGNVFSDITGGVFHHRGAPSMSLLGGGITAEILEGLNNRATLVYHNNLFYNTPSIGGPAKKIHTIKELHDVLEEAKATVYDVGKETKESPYVNADKQDFRLNPSSKDKITGVKLHIPFSLYATVGEWNFRPYKKNYNLIVGENFFMTEEHSTGAKSWHMIPQNNLNVPDAKKDWFVEGPSESFTASALSLDGKKRFARLLHEDIISDYEIKNKLAIKQEHCGERLVSEECAGEKYPGSKRITVDMDTNNFLIEVYLQIESGHQGGGIAGKMGASGYDLTVGDDGKALLTIKAGGETAILSSKTVINDGKWHHIIAEVDRSAKKASIYIDGKLSKEGSIKISESISLKNKKDLQIGKSGEGEYLAATIDFLRICRGTLKDSETTIEEVYEWEFNGPHLHDFMGKDPIDGKRGAGAFGFAK